jgi:preprotein translocase subunit SecF
MIVGTSSSIFIAAPILLYLGQNKLSGTSRPTAMMATVAPD